MMRAGRRTRALIAFALLCCSVGSAHAQISLITAVDLALKNDPRVRSAQATLDKAKASLAQAHDAYIPGASITGGDGKSAGVPTSLPVIFSITSQSLIFTFSQRDYIRAAHAGIEAAKLALQDAQAVVMEDVATTYVSLDSAERRRDAMGQEYGYATRLASITEDRVTAGQDTQMDMLRSKRTAHQIALQKLQIEDEVANLSDHLARVIGIPGTPMITVSTSIPALTTIDLTATDTDSPGIRSAFANAKAKREIAFGDSRYRFRPQISFGAGYSRISTVGTNYFLYYPAFSPDNIAKKDLSLNALSIGAQVQIPFYDKGHQDRARESAAEASRLEAEAQSQRNQFLEGRFKLSHSAQEASARAAIAKDDVAIAQAQIDVVLVQLNADAADPNRPQMTPKDEQNARLQERQRYVEMLDAELSLTETQINLLRQTGALADWLRMPTPEPANVVAAPLSR